jgi:glutamate carboxypeptidase
MREIVTRNLPGTRAEIAFTDRYPAMPPTPGNHRLLAAYGAVSRTLGYGDVTAVDPERRGTGDVSFVAPYVDALDGLGAIGDGVHSPAERIDLASLARQTRRAAVLLHRLTHQR